MWFPKRKFQWSHLGLGPSFSPFLYCFCFYPKMVSLIIHTTQIITSPGFPCKKCSGRAIWLQVRRRVKLDSQGTLQNSEETLTCALRAKRSCNIFKEHACFQGTCQKLINLFKLKLILQMDFRPTHSIIGSWFFPSWELTFYQDSTLKMFHIWKIQPRNLWAMSFLMPKGQMSIMNQHNFLSCWACVLP